jgi:hypothetical protein
MIQVIDKIQKILEDVPLKIVQFSEKDLTFKISPEKWSKKEIFGHLIDSALHNLQRLLYAQIEPQPYLIKSYPQDELVKVNQYQQQSIGKVLDLWKQLNQQIIWVLQNISLENSNLIFELKGGELWTLRDWFEKDYVPHLEHHIKQIFD